MGVDEVGEGKGEEGEGEEGGEEGGGVFLFFRLLWGVFLDIVEGFFT